MSEDRINITFECKDCGGTVLTTPDDEITADSVMSCKKCGQRFGAYGEIEAQARNAALDQAKGALRDAFKGSKGWKLK
ncbi:ECs_2282 family putative zinc-binding protein [Henriciella pelagia]|uniref:ECs_2282 family putative zinc-binding protein n=1 Tax=Alphaproteobacteria TaxID=28211 RepID=UPI003F7D9BB0